MQGVAGITQDTSKQHPIRCIADQISFAPPTKLQDPHLNTNEGGNTHLLRYICGGTSETSKNVNFECARALP